ncbi:MAG: undecaprenyl-phosphate glucose phosphotransferase [Planctomycetota bacterium]|nr:MAG: undecaprenyl-phosphate glucose phosphotransferase [Planctomycetota bacterium]
MFLTGAATQRQLRASAGSSGTARLGIFGGGFWRLAAADPAVPFGGKHPDTMLSRRSETSRVALFLLDQLALAGAFALAFLVKRHLVLADAALDADRYLQLYTFTAPVLAFALSACGFYRLRGERFPPTGIRSRDLLWGGFVSMLTLVLVGFLVKPEAADGTPLPAWSRGVAFLFLGSATLGLYAARKLLMVASVALAGEAGRQARVLVFGMSPRVLRLLEVFRRSPHMHLEVCGVAARHVPDDLAPAIDTTDAVAQLEQGRVDHVIIEAGDISEGLLDELLRLADREGISVHITSPIFPSTKLVPAWERLGGVPVLGFVAAELPFGARVAKRAFDIACSSVALLLLAPFLIPLAALIRAESPGPALFVQERVGRRGKSFRMYKFRTMRRDAENGTGPTFAVVDDPRCTRMGSFLRRWNLDELPQLLNVFLGHMSLVGPRPERPAFVRDFKRTVPRYAHKHWVRPGITGWAQVHGLRGAGTSIEERVDHDLYYIENWSLMMDIRILLRTVVDGYVNAA